MVFPSLSRIHLQENADVPPTARSPARCGLKDICGLTGLLIIRAICGGETNPQKLAALRHGNCRKSEEEIAWALQSNGRKDYLFALQQELETYNHLQKKIELCDVEIQKMLDIIINSDDHKGQHH